MKAQITTTITTLIDVETMTPDHSIYVECNDGLPESIVRAAVLGAARALTRKLEGDSDD